ncbi:MAG: HAMP domain-containing sensor histidine kinase [Gemmatimonadaceae bacterium]
MRTQPSDADLTRGIALVCGHDGMIRSILHDDLCLNGVDACGRQLSTIVDASITDKVTSFLAEAIARGAAFDWELSVNVDGVTQVVHFAAATTPPDALVVVGATSRSGMMHFYDELMRVNNEQANALRQAVKARTSERPDDRDAEVYEQLTQLNNELATVQREVTKKNIALERANVLKNQFLGMAAHDLRNPIGAIRSFATLLLDDDMTLTVEQRHTFLERIRASSEFMLALINDLLDLSAIEAGQLRVDARELDIARVVRDNVNLNAILASEKAIDIELEIAPDVPVIVADALKLEQILNNLMSNAVKFSARETVVRVTVRREDEGVLIAVSDQGPGIAAAEITEIFKPFQRGSPRGTAGERSTGLGLAIVKRIIDAHGGRLTCESEVGRGTTFRAWLPLARPASAYRFR